MDSKEVLFSVIVPAFNRRQHLLKLIEKFSAISYEKWELIVVDDGSTDNTASLFENINSDRIKYVKQKNCERGAARNHGIKIATGDYVTFLDSDDFLMPNVFSVACAIINENCGIALFHLGYEIRNVENRVLSPAEKLPELLNDLLIEKNVMACLGLFIKRDVAQGFLFNEDRDLAGSEDYELWIRMAAVLPIRHFNFTVAVLVEHQGRSMQEFNVSKIVLRIEKFIHYALINPQTSAFIGSRKNEFIAYRFSYISLHAALAFDKALSIRFLWKAVLKFPKLLVQFRFYVIVKKMIWK